MTKKLKLDPMTDVILATVAEATAALQLDNSRLRAWQSQDKRKFQELFALLVEIDGVLAHVGVSKNSPIRTKLNAALK